MKCIERLEIEWPNDYANKAYEKKCPHVYGYAAKPVNCEIGHHDVSRTMCEDCWHRELDADDEAVGDRCENKPTILDSGNRREFETGAVRDIQEGKGRCDLMPLDVVAEMYGYFHMVESHEDEVFADINSFKHTGYIHKLFEAVRDSHIFEDPQTMLLEVSKHFEEGAKKYGENNWQKGIPTHCYIDSAVRHYLKYLRGDTDERHDRAFVWNIVCCIWTCIHMPELNDYAKGSEE